MATIPVYFHPSHWGTHFLLHEYTPKNLENKQQWEKEVEQLKEKVREKLLSLSDQQLEQIEFISAIERLGVAYHFEKEIAEALESIYENYEALCKSDDLYTVSTIFFVLRAFHGYRIPDTVFEKFKDDKGGFKGDIKGLLGLYECSHARTHGDNILEEACAFTTAFLKSNVADNTLDSPLAEQVAHALHQPLHKGIPRIEFKAFISFYEQDPSHDKTLLRFAKVDFNLLQLHHQKELQDISRWWYDLYEKLPFARDRIVEAYVWVLGAYYELKYEAARKLFIKIFMICQVIDDIFDAYGTYETLQLLVEAISRLDRSDISRFPKYFDECYRELLDIIDECEEYLAKVGKEAGMVPFKKQLNRACEAWLAEAEWLKKKHFPSFEEYFENAIISIGHVVGILGSFIGMGGEAAVEGFEYVGSDPMPSPVRGAIIIFRGLNDLASTKIEQNSREHIVSSIQCYKRENPHLEEEEVYQALEKVIDNAWKDVNEKLLRPFVIPKPMLDRLTNCTRGAEVYYKDRHDAYTVVTQAMKEKCASVLVHPCQL